jgi:hypothetical protein
LSAVFSFDRDACRPIRYRFDRHNEAREHFTLAGQNILARYSDWPAAAKEIPAPFDLVPIIQSELLLHPNDHSFVLPAVLPLEGGLEASVQALELSI